MIKTKLGFGQKCYHNCQGYINQHQQKKSPMFL